MSIVLSKRQLDVIPYIADSCSLKDVALKTGVSQVTLEKWMDDAYFAGALEAYLEQKYQSALRMLKTRAVEAVSVLTEEMTASKPNKDRILAADKVLLHTLKYLENVEFRAKIEEVQRQMRDHNESEGETEEAGESASLTEGEAE